jgi:hypothetical protein
VARYKVDRLREQSWVLAPHDSVDAIGAFSRRVTDHRGAAVSAVTSTVDRDARLQAIGELVEQGHGDPAVLDAVLELATQLPAADAVRVARRAHDLALLLPAAQRGALHSRALVVADLLGDRDLAARAADGVIADGAKSTELAGTLFRALAIARRDPALTTRLLDAFDAPTASDLAARTVWAGAMQSRDRQRAQVTLSAAFADHDVLTSTQKLERRRALARAAHLGQLAGARQTALWLADLWPTNTDSFGTNSHYCLTAVAFADIVVLAIL